MPRLFTRLYGASPLHLLLLGASFAAVGYCVALASDAAKFGQMLVWFVAAVLVHDALVLPLCSLVDRVLRTGVRHRPPLVNHIRVPLLGSGLLFLLFFPGIIRQGAATHIAATGLDQEPFLGRWLALSGLFALLSGLVYSTRVLLTRSTASRNHDT